MWANLHFWAETARLAWRTRSWADRLLIWFKPPGWYPPDVEPQVIDQSDVKFDPPTTGFARAYVFVQFWLLTFASLWLLQAQADLPRVFVLTAFVWMCFSLFVQGAWLEGRPRARRVEWMRIASALALAAAAYFIWPAASGAAPGIAAYVAVSAAALGISQMIASRGGALRADHSTQPT